MRYIWKLLRKNAQLNNENTRLAKTLKLTIEEHEETTVYYVNRLRLAKKVIAEQEREING